MKALIKRATIGFKIALLTTVVLLGACEEFLDVNESPNNLTTSPINLILTNITVNVGFRGGSDLHRYSSIFTRQFSGQGQAGVQTRQAESYNVLPTDLNNLFSAFYATQLADIEKLIESAEAGGAPHYTGVAKLLKAWTYHQIVDTWGDAPFSEAVNFTGNTAPAYDNDSDIYTAIFALIDEGISDLAQATSALSPKSDDTIFAGDRTKWTRFANTLKLRLFLHYSEVDPTFATSGMTTLINSGAEFMMSNVDNFQHTWLSSPNAQNGVDQFEVRRQDQFFPDNFMVTMMNTNNDPRRRVYFTDFPFGSGSFVGAIPGAAQSKAYSRVHTYLRGPATSIPATVNADGSLDAQGTRSITYAGTAPTRLLTFAEYNFIRAEAALRFGVPGDPQTFYTAGITASMAMAAVSNADRNTYLASPRGTLSGTPANQLQQIIEEKYVANYGVVLEPWTDFRRTGFPVVPVSPVAAPTQQTIPTVLFYPQSEIDSNPNSPAKNRANMSDKVFWDN